MNPVQSDAASLKEQLPLLKNEGVTAPAGIIPYNTQMQLHVPKEHEADDSFVLRPTLIVEAQRSPMRARRDRRLSPHKSAAGSPNKTSGYYDPRLEAAHACLAPGDADDVSNSPNRVISKMPT